MKVENQYKEIIQLLVDPDSSNRFELIVTYLPGGKMSEYLFKECKIGDEFAYRGPMGIFTLPENLEERDIYFVLQVLVYLLLELYVGIYK